MAWFRFHDGTLDNPKAQRLSGDLFKDWVNLMCLSNRQSDRGALPGWSDIAFALRRSEEECKEMVNALQAAKLVDDIDGVLRLHDWATHQYKSDVSTPRVKQHRERKKKQRRQRSEKQQGNVSGNAPEAEQNRADDQTPAGSDQSAPVATSPPVAPSAPAPGGARSVAVAPWPIDGAMNTWSIRLRGHRLSETRWPPKWGSAPESGDENSNLDDHQRRSWRRHYGLPAEWRKAAA